MTHEQRARLDEIVKELQDILCLKVISGYPAARETVLLSEYDMIVDNSEGQFLTDDE